MSNQIVRKLAVFCLTSATLSVGTAITASSASAGTPISTWTMNGNFDAYWYPYNSTAPLDNLYTNTFDYSFVIDTATHNIGTTADLFLSSKPKPTTMTYFGVKSSNLGFASHTDEYFSQIGTNKFSTSWKAKADNFFFSPLSNISSMKLEIERIDANLFNLKLYGYNPSNEIKVMAFDSKASFQYKDTIPEPSTIFGLLGLAALALKAVKKNPNNSDLVSK